MSLLVLPLVLARPIQLLHSGGGKVVRLPPLIVPAASRLWHQLVMLPVPAILAVRYICQYNYTQLNYTYTYIYIYNYIYTCMCVYISLSLYIYIYIYTYIY